MQFLRSKKSSIFTTAIFGVIILSFIIWGTMREEQTSPSILVTVNGEDIPYREFQRLFSRQLEMYDQMFGANANQGKMREQLVNMVDRQVASGLVMRKILAQQADKVGIVIGNTEILENLKKNEAFQDPGVKKFSPKTYQRVLEANDLKPNSYEASLKEEFAAERMRHLIESAVAVTASEVSDIYRLDKTEATLEVGIFDPEMLEKNKKVVVTDAAAKEYFTKHQGEYLSSEKRVASVGWISTAAIGQKIEISSEEIQKHYETLSKANGEDFKTAQVHALHILISDSSPKGLARAQALQKAIKTQNDFRQAAIKNSEDYSNASKGGDLGYFSETTMVKPFADAAFRTAPLNAVSTPVKTDFGYHLLWVIDRTGTATTLDARKNQMAYQIRQTKLDAELATYQKSVESMIAKESDPMAALKTKGFEFETTTPFDSKTRLTTFPYILVQKAMSAEKGKWQGPEESQGKLYVYRIEQVTAPQPMTFEEARSQVTRKLLSEQSEALAKTAVDDFKNGKRTWDQIQTAGMTVTTHKAFKIYRTTEVPGLSTTDTVTKALGELRKSNTAASPFLSDGKWVLLKAKDWNQPVAGTAVPEADAKKLREELLTKRKGVLLEEYTQKLLKTAKITDSFRKKYNL